MIGGGFIKDTASVNIYTLSLIYALIILYIYIYIFIRR